MKWEYITRSWQFAGPDIDEWPGRERYTALLTEQQAKNEQRNRSTGTGSFTLASSGIISSEALRDWAMEEVPEGPESAELTDRYVEWRDRTELEYLNEIGHAGFEMVSMNREVERERHSPRYVYYYAFPVVRVHCCFKRAKYPDAPAPPSRQIGIRIEHPVDKEADTQDWLGGKAAFRDTSHH